MKQLFRFRSLRLVCILMMLIISACSSSPPIENTSSNTSSYDHMFSFYGNQIDIKNLPDYVPNSNVSLSIQNLNDNEKMLYNDLAKIYQYLHSGNFDYVSAFNESTASNEFDSDVFAVFDFTVDEGETIFDYLRVIELFYATQSEVYYLDINEIVSTEYKMTFGMRFEYMYEYAAKVDDLNAAIISTNEYIEVFYRELKGKVLPGASRYDIVKLIHDEVIDRVEYDFSESIMGGTIAGTVTPDVRKILCNGYARTMYYYLSRFDIPCIIVFGGEKDGISSGGHVWNYVQMDDGKWYLLDATWDDMGEDYDTSYEYFLVGSRAVSASHIPLEISSLEKKTLEFYNYPMPNAIVYEVDTQLYVGGSFNLPNFNNIDYDDYFTIVYVVNYLISDFRDIRSIVHNDGTSVFEQLTNYDGAILSKIPATMKNYSSGTEFDTKGKYIAIILDHQITEEKITIIFTNPIK